MLRRLIDIAVSFLMLAIASLPMAFIAAILKVTGEHEVLYFQERVGKSGRTIRIAKFVTMVKNSADLGTRDITVKNDPRVLPIGRLLRKTKLNEFPQFWDVLVGKLSLVGWRPLLRSGFEYYPKDVQAKILTMRPGLTGLGSLFFRNEEAIVEQALLEGLDLHQCYREEIMPFKGALECWYVDNHSPFVDAKIVLATAIAVLMPNWRGYRNWFRNLPTNESRLVEKAMDSSV